VNSTTGFADRALIDALARRAHAYGGETRRILDARLAQLSAACAEATGPTDSETTFVSPQAAAPSPLATLLAHIANNTAGAPIPDVSSTTGRAELKSIQQFRGTWTRLRVDQRLQQSQALVPGNAGPLNTQRLLHQALTAMGEVSPDYLQRFMAQVEALLWIEQAGEAAAAGKRSAVRSGR
jgi:hypothetical protein